MIRAYQLDPPAWLKTYHRRNTVESMFAGIKRRLGGKLRALARHTLRMEACLKLVAWNLTRFSYAEF